ncbi:MAG TPA: hypothetical protein PLG33_05705, partial [Prolixibacteraceae bacterium]|nr:hypothetical protein [Prolixibacteraceae bacterium]
MLWLKPTTLNTQMDELAFNKCTQIGIIHSLFDKRLGGQQSAGGVNILASTRTNGGENPFIVEPILE